MSFSKKIRLMKSKKENQMRMLLQMANQRKTTES